MLHKAPASFGLVTYLLHEGLDKPRIKRHLLVFSLAAPVLAILTYLLLTLHGQVLLSASTSLRRRQCKFMLLLTSLLSSKGNLDTLSGTGTAMLFSAGTFLYVATVHVLPEVKIFGSLSYFLNTDILEFFCAAFR